MKIAEIKQLPSGSPIPEVIFKVTKADWAPKRDVKFGNMDHFVLAEDNTEKSAIKLKCKDKRQDFSFQVGKFYKATAGNKKSDGSLCGLKWNGSDKGAIEITDSAALVEVSGYGDSAGTSQTKTYSGTQQAKQTQSTEDPVEFIIQFGKTYLRIEEILSPVLGDKMRGEIVTSCMIQCERRGIQVVKPPKQSWKSIKVNGKALGEMNAEELKPVVLRRLEKPYANDVLNEGFKEILIAASCSGSMLFMDAQRFYGVEGDDMIDTVLLKNWKTQEDVTQDQLIELSINPEFWSDVKKHIEERASAAPSGTSASSVEEL